MNKDRIAESRKLGDGLAGDTMLQRHAIEKLHGDERLVVVLSDFIDGADVGMIQGRRGLGFALEGKEETDIRDSLMAFA